VHGLIPEFANCLRRNQPIRIAAPRGRLVSPVFVGDVVYILLATLARPDNGTWKVGGPTAHRERELIEDLARRLGVTARIVKDRSLRPARFDTDNP
jgi:nucleoside-diphosphate-sugar epimerase